MLAAVVLAFVAVFKHVFATPDMDTINAHVKKETLVKRNPHNCLADVIMENGLERRELQRRNTWSYEGSTGPAQWGDPKIGNIVCKAGENQSPINIEGKKLIVAAHGHPDVYHWPPIAKNISFVNDGHTIELYFNASKFFSVTNQINGQDYNMIRMHLHAPSEHHVGGKFYPLEAHFVHVSPAGGLNVIGVFFELGTTNNTFLASFIKNLPPLPTGSQKKTTTYAPRVDLSGIANHIQGSDFYTYSGSLTTPPCTEGVLWTVAKRPMILTVDQFKALTAVMPYNSRLTMPNKSAGAP